jgi:hypothetical protein
MNIGQILVIFAIVDYIPRQGLRIWPQEAGKLLGDDNSVESHGCVVRGDRGSLSPSDVKETQFAIFGEHLKQK